MSPARVAHPVPMPARAVYRIEDGEGMEVTAITGTIWITQAKDARDVILARGQSFVLDCKGRAVLYALKDAAVVVGPPDRIAAADRAATAV